jgi:hypothetical protein
VSPVRHPFLVLAAGVTAAVGAVAWRGLGVQVDHLRVDLGSDDLRFAQRPPALPAWRVDPTTRDGIYWADGRPITFSSGEPPSR